MSGFSVKLQRARVAAGMSQVELAAAAGVSRQTIRNWEAGRSQPQRGNLGRLAKVLGVEPDDLLWVGENDDDPPPRLDEYELVFELRVRLQRLGV